MRYLPDHTTESTKNANITCQRHDDKAIPLSGLGASNVNTSRDYPSNPTFGISTSHKTSHASKDTMSEKDTANTDNSEHEEEHILGPSEWTPSTRPLRAQPPRRFVGLLWVRGFLILTLSLLVCIAGFNALQEGLFWLDSPGLHAWLLRWGSTPTLRRKAAQRLSLTPQKAAPYRASIRRSLLTELDEQTCLFSVGLLKAFAPARRDKEALLSAMWKRH